MKMLANSSKVASFAVIAKLSSFIKVSFMVGSQMIWFSGINSVLPLAGAFGGMFGAGLVFLMRQLIHLLFFKTVSLSFLAMCVPGFCASLYWATNSAIIRLFLPIVCMGLFVAHPVGAQAFVYSLYWLIPIVLYCVPRKSLFLHALASTFVAHAVGSVIWCYTVPMTPALWMGLLPIVFVERILFAFGMVVAHHVLAWIFGMLDDVSKQRTVVAVNALSYND